MKARILKYTVIAVSLLLCMTGCKLTVTEFDSATDYGKIVGNGSDLRAQEMFDEMFPEKIEDFFYNPIYHYIARYGIDARAFEIALEFTIEDADTFNDYLAKMTVGKSCEVFPYDEEYQCYTITSPWIALASKTPCDESYCKDRPEHYHIDAADIELMLVQPETRHFVFVAMGVKDGGGVDTHVLGWFFNRFNIDPHVYAEENQWRRPTEE